MLFARPEPSVGPSYVRVCSGIIHLSPISMSAATSRLVCFQCKSDYSGPKRPMLRCTSCKKGWHTCTQLSRLPRRIEIDLVIVCHNPVIALGQYKAMYEAEMNRKAGVRFSTWRCSLCSNRPTPNDQPVLVCSWSYTTYRTV